MSMTLEERKAAGRLLIGGVVIFLVALFVDRVVIEYFKPGMEHLQIKHIAFATITGMLIEWFRYVYSGRTQD
jgi:hypothetical protein